MPGYLVSDIQACYDEPGQDLRSLAWIEGIQTRKEASGSKTTSEDLDKYSWVERNIQAPSSGCFHSSSTITITIKLAISPLVRSCVEGQGDKGPVTLQRVHFSARPRCNLPSAMSGNDRRRHNGLEILDPTDPPMGQAGSSTPSKRGFSYDRNGWMATPNVKRPKGNCSTMYDAGTLSFWNANGRCLSIT